MSAPSRETAGTVRSAHVAYFLPPDWGRIARHIQPALERIVRGTAQTQVLVIVPDAGAALALARTLAALPAAAERRVVAASSGARAGRLLAAGTSHVVVGAPATLAPVLAASVLKLDGLQTVVLAAADELEADSPELAALMAEVPRTAARMLTALVPSPGVEALLERYLHRARRVTEDVAPAEDAAPASAVVRYLTVAGPAVEALPAVLDEVDAPSTIVLAGDDDAADQARALLRGIGYHDESLVRVTTGEVPANPALVILLGVPTATAWGAALAAQPARAVAIVSVRELPALQLLAGAVPLQPVAARGAVARARAADARMRAELRAELAEGVPTREVLALEPLLGEHDGLEIAAAALRLLERTRASQAELVAAAEQRVRKGMQEAAREAAERDGPRDGGREERPRGFAPRGKPGFGDRPRPGARSFGDRPPRGDKPFGDRPPRGEKPHGERAPRGERPFGDRPPRGDKPRGPRRDDPRGRPPRGER